MLMVSSSQIYIFKRIQAKILQQVTITYGGEIGFNQAIELASGALGNIKFIQQKRILCECSMKNSIE